MLYTLQVLHHETQLPQHCHPRFEQTSQASQPQHNIIHYGNYNSSHQQTDIVTNGPMSQQTNFTDGITAGDMSSHIIRGNKGNGNNIQAVDMDVNEILKVRIHIIITSILLNTLGPLSFYYHLDEILSSFFSKLG